MADSSSNPVSILRQREYPQERVVPLPQKDLEEYIARTNAIVYLNKKRQEHLEEVQRCEMMAVYLQEALTLRIGRAYSLDIEHEQWHLDLQERKLVYLGRREEQP